MLYGNASYQFLVQTFRLRFLLFSSTICSTANDGRETNVKHTSYVLLTVTSLVIYGVNRIYILKKVYSKTMLIIYVVTLFFLINGCIFSHWHARIKYYLLN